MSNTNIYHLLVEGRIGDNIKATKRLFNNVLEQAREDKELFEKQFVPINEKHNIDCSDVKSGFSKVSACLKEAKALITESSSEKSKNNLKKAQELIKKAHKKLKEAERVSESNVDSFHSVVTIAEGLESKQT